MDCLPDYAAEYGAARAMRNKQPVRPRWRLRLLLLGLLAAVSALGLLQHYPASLLSRVSTPYSCQPNVPAGIPELLSLAQKLGYLGFQLAWTNTQGEHGSCAVGWAHIGMWPRRMTSTHRLRYLSLTKLLTATVAMQLIAEQRLALTDQVVERLDIALPYRDPRVAEILVAHLLEHTGGFDRSITPDPMFQPEPFCPNHLDALAALRLDHAPGSIYAYANLGYCLLGAIIERIEQKPLVDVFAQRLFTPARTPGIRQAHSTQPADDEPTYFADPRETYDELPKQFWAASIATGAFTGTAEELRDLLTAIFCARQPLLTPETQAQMLHINRSCEISQWRTCHGYGLYAYRTANGSLMYWRDGSLPGATSFAALFENGSIVVFLANSRRRNWMTDNDRLGKWLSSYGES